MSLPEHQQICTRPFEWFEVHPDGSVFLCCPAWLKRPVGNLLQQSVEQIWNSAVAVEIRKSILNGSFHSCGAGRCPHLASRTAPVKALGQVRETTVRNAIAKRAATLDYRPPRLNLCFDYSCNLACPSCRRQPRQAGGADLEQAERIRAILLKELIPNARSLTLSGFGDPFGSPTYLGLLKQLNQPDFPQLQQVRLHTNGQLLTPRMWQSLPDLQPLVSEIEISLDAASEAGYHRNRPGGDFQQLLANLNFIRQQQVKLTLSMVVQQNNWREIPQLLALAEGLNARLYLSQLVNWGTFSRTEFRRRAVHLRDHPEYRSLQCMLQGIKGITGVELGNLTKSFALD